MSHSAAEIDKHVKTYIKVFVVLLLLTGVTVAVSYLKLPLLWAVLVALAVACTKGSLVVGFFMHLINEFKEKKPMLFWPLVLTVTFFFVAMLLPLFTYLDRLGQ